MEKIEELNTVNQEKYYVPNIEEFYMGFEYEVLYNDIIEGVNKWGKFSNPFAIQRLESFIENGSIRVKYLDKEDIEDLGLLYDNDSGSFKKWGKYKMYELVKKENIINISIYQQNKMVSTILPFSTWEEFNIFNGEIKNKSKLNKLMEQLNIND